MEISGNVGGFILRETLVIRMISPIFDAETRDLIRRFKCLKRIP